MLDSMSGFFQLAVRNKYKPSSFMFMYVITFHTLYMALAAFFLSGEHIQAYGLFSSSRDAVKDQIMLTTTNVMGLLFIYAGVGLLGPIKLAFITSSRKVFSVVASIVLFDKRIDGFMMSGIILVLSGMLAENFIKDNKGKVHKPETDGVDNTLQEKLTATSRADYDSTLLQEDLEKTTMTGNLTLTSKITRENGQE